MFDVLDALDADGMADRRLAVVSVVSELDKAIRRFGPFASPHEGYSVILEELDELWQEVRDNKRLPEEYRLALHGEAVQVAAMALRFVIECCPTPERIAPTAGDTSEGAGR